MRSKQNTNIHYEASDFKELQDYYQRKKLSAHLYEIGFITILGIFLSFVLSGFQFYWPQMLAQSTFVFALGALLWKGNEFGSTMIWFWDIKRGRPQTTFMLSLVYMLIYSALVILVVNFVWQEYVFEIGFRKYINSPTGVVHVLIQFMVSIIITMTIYSLNFFKHWRLSILRTKNLEHEKTSLEYEALKNQVNPHFLFNSLNSLSSLVETDIDKSKEFIRQLAGVYRYVLEAKSKDLSSVEDEMQFLQSYIFLQRIRFGDSLQMKVDIKNRQQKMIPLCAQILAENAIKHNIIDEDQILTIDIQEQDGFLIFRNNLQSRRSVLANGNADKSLKLGLENLKSRYSILSKKKFKAEKTANEFIVHVPLIGNDD